MGYQFVRVELFSRKGKSGRGTDFVFDEVSRKPDASLHVREPRRPDVAYGLEIDDLRALHDERASLAKVVVNGKAKAIRRDQNSLCTVIVSHPAFVQDFFADPAVEHDVLDWERRSIDWLKSRFGDELMSVVRHLDESHPHLHAYLVPNDTEMRATKFHPGFLAKNKAKSTGPTSGEDEKAHRKRADGAYVEAMRAFLNDFHHHVAIPSGLARLGPKKRRLTRAQWQQEKMQAQSLKTTLERAQTVKDSGEKFIAKIRADAAKIAKNTELQQEASRKARDAALAALDRVRQATEVAEASIATAERYAGWAGHLRALWDAFRHSHLVDQIRSELSREIAHWRAKAQDAERQKMEVERMCFRAQQEAREAHNASLKANIERDRLRSILQYPRDIVTSAPKPTLAYRPRLPLEDHKG